MRHAKAANCHKRPTAYFEGTHVIKRTIAVHGGSIHQDHTAGHFDRTVGINPVAARVHIHLTGIQIDPIVLSLAALIPGCLPAGHAPAAIHARAICSTRGIDAVVRREQRNFTAVYRNHLGFKPFVAFGNIDRPCVDCQRQVGVQAVIAGRDGEGAVIHGDIAVGVQRVIGSIDNKPATFNDYRSQAFDRLGGHAVGIEGRIARIEGEIPGQNRHRPFSANCVADRTNLQRGIGYLYLPKFFGIIVI